jgi:two-component system, cell cycle sensor histidine kinase and response regulator CckA
VDTILVVDDELVVLSVVEASLRLAGYDVVTASSAQDAIRTAAKFAGRMALVIVNHSIASTAGQRLVDEIEQLQPGVKVLRVSGHMEEHLRATGQIKPESFFLQKPFTARALREKVRDVIGPS